jgi:hypothetical protein
MKNTLVRTSMIVAIAAMSAGVASAQTTVTLPDSSQSTTFTATVSEQARVLVPASVIFNVANTAISTAASAASVTVDNIALATATKQLKISLKANAAAFTPPTVGGITWAAADVSWNAATFSGTGSAGAIGALNNDFTTYVPVVTCGADLAACSTANLVFTLAPKSTVKSSGNHTLIMTWMFESIGT